MKKLLCAAAVLLASTTFASAAGELQLFNWGDYTNPELLKKFEAETGIKVTVTDYDANDTALAKIEAGGGGYDLVVPSANYIPIYIEKGLIQKLDLSRLPNHGNIAPEWMDVAWDKGRNYSVPWQWGSTGMAVGGCAGTATGHGRPPHLIRHCPDGKCEFFGDPITGTCRRRPRSRHGRRAPAA